MLKTVVLNGSLLLFWSI